LASVVILLLETSNLNLNTMPYYLIEDEIVQRIEQKLDLLIDTRKASSEVAVRTKPYTIPEICEIFGVCKRTVHNWVNAGLLPPMHIGRRAYFRTQDVERLANGQRRKFNTNKERK